MLTSRWRTVLSVGLGLLAIGVFTLWLLQPMLAKTFPITHSTQFDLSWGFQYQRQFMEGQFYPRWLEYSNFGFGNATFAFYPPLCMVATLPFRLLGLDLPASLVGSVGLSIGLLGIGLFGYTRRFFPLWIALLVAMGGMAGPYFLTDSFIRGALGEVWAITVLPWILWTTQGVVEQKASFRQDPWPVVRLAVAYGMLVLSHLPTLLVFTLAWIPLPWLMSQSGSRWGSLSRCYGGALLSFVWTAFYLWPAALDQGLTQVASVNAAPEYQPQHRLMVSHLLTLNPKLATHWFDVTLFPFWWLMVGTLSLAALTWVVTLYWGKRGSCLEVEPSPGLGATVGGWLVSTTLAALMMTDILGWSYDYLIPLQRIQFSWRWMSVTSVTTPLLMGYLVRQAEQWVRISLKPPQQRYWATAMAGGIGIVALVMIWVGIHQGYQFTRRAPYDPALVTRFALLAEAKRFPVEPQQSPGQNFLFWHWIYPDGLALVDVPEYRAKGVSFWVPPQRVHSLVEWQTGAGGDLQVQHWQYGFRQFRAVNPDPTPQAVLLRTFYYPAWRVQRDGDWIPTERTPEGQLMVTIPPGQHEIKVTYLGTWADGLGRAATGVVLIGGLGWLMWRPSQTRSALGPEPEAPVSALEDP